MVKGRPIALARDGQDGRCVFGLVEEDGRLIGSFEFGLGRARGALSCVWLTLLTAATAAVHEGLTKSLRHNDTQISAAVPNFCFSDISNTQESGLGHSN